MFKKMPDFMKINKYNKIIIFAIFPPNKIQNSRAKEAKKTNNNHAA
jgi:hypothetical protein